jgi:hypothetical protein
LDATYGNGEFLQWLPDRGITPYMRTRDSALRKNNPGYGPERFTYLPGNNSYRCPAGEQLTYVGLNVRNRAHAYIGSAKRCGACSHSILSDDRLNQNRSVLTGGDLLQLGVFRLGCLQDRDVCVSLFPQRKEVLVRRSGFRNVMCHRIGTTDL